MPVLGPSVDLPLVALQAPSAFFLYTTPVRWKSTTKGQTSSGGNHGEKRALEAPHDVGASNRAPQERQPSFWGKASVPITEEAGD
jgi:hypothetical protein